MKRWWHITTPDTCEIFEDAREEKEIEVDYGTLYGPFPSYEAANKDAIKYYKACITLLEDRIKKLRKELK